MEIGILTFHMAHNFGAMLQAYALCSKVRKLAGCSCCIIDYRLPEIYKKYEILLKREPVEMKRIKFELFMNHYLNLSPRVMDLYEVPRYDLYIIGSDQIWNPVITKGYKDEYFGKMFPEDSLCISYGASTGVDIGDWKYLADKLENIKRIGVRETWCAENLSRFLKKKVIYCVDPVFLLDTDEWGNLTFDHTGEKYILIYAFEMYEKEYKEIEEQAEKGGYRIIEIVTHTRDHRNGIIYDVACGPQEFLGYMKAADYIYTDSYHGVLFSIIFEKKFIYLSRGERNDARVFDVLDQLQLLTDRAKYIKMTPAGKDILHKYKMESLTFLEECICEAKI